MYFLTLGCPGNFADSAVMQRALAAQGWTPAVDAASAQLIVVNTCSLTGDAQETAIDAILAMAEHKRDGACTHLVVAGCLSQRHMPDLQAALPEVDHFIGTGDLRSIARRVGGPRPSQCTAATPSTARPGPATVVVAASSGCSNSCTFCVVPGLRGRQRSVPLEQILAQAQAHLDAGAVEIVVTSHDVGRWGEDLQPQATLVDLIEGLESLGSGLLPGRPLWLRLTSAHPDHLSHEAIAAWGAARFVLPYIDLPLQHIDASVLTRMGRGLGPEALRDRIAELRQRVPNLSLGTTLMVGFPSETLAQFEALQAFVAEMRFDRLTVMAYAAQDGTPAARVAPQLPEAEIERRAQALRALQAEISLELHEAQVGRHLEVLVTGPCPQTPLLWQGRHMAQGVPEDGVTYITAGRARPGDMVQLRIDAAHHADLAGEIVAAPATNHVQANVIRPSRKAYRA